MTIVRLRQNARIGDAVRLNAEFFSGGEFFNPLSVERVEIYRGGDGPKNGGVLVDVVMPPNIFQSGLGQFYVVLDLPYSYGSPGSPCSPAPGMSPSPLVSPDAPVIYANERYWDRWVYKKDLNSRETYSVGLSFYLYPNGTFVASDVSKFRFDMKPDRKRIIKGEDLDVRLMVIPIPLYISNRDPIVDYLLPICTMKAKLIDQQYHDQVCWTDLVFTGKEGIFPTGLMSNLQLGEYWLVAELGLPNGQKVRYPRMPLQLQD